MRDFHSARQGMTWTLVHPRATLEMLDYIPGFLSAHDPRPAAQQIDEHYIAGWSPFDGFKMLPSGNMHYPGDPPTLLLAQTKLRDEVIRFYQHAWLAIIQPDGSFEVARLD